MKWVLVGRRLCRCGVDDGVFSVTVRVQRACSQVQGCVWSGKDADPNNPSASVARGPPPAAGGAPGWEEASGRTGHVARIDDLQKVVVRLSNATSARKRCSLNSLFCLGSGADVFLGIATCTQQPFTVRPVARRFFYRGGKSTFQVQTTR